MERRLRQLEVAAAATASRAMLREMVDQVARERGLDPDEVMAEAEVTLREHGGKGMHELVAAIAAEQGRDPADLLAEAESWLTTWQQRGTATETTPT